MRYSAPSFIVNVCALSFVRSAEGYIIGITQTDKVKQLQSRFEQD